MQVLQYFFWDYVLKCMKNTAWICSMINGTSLTSQTRRSAVRRLKSLENFGNIKCWSRGPKWWVLYLFTHCQAIAIVMPRNLRGYQYRYERFYIQINFPPQNMFSNFLKSLRTKTPHLKYFYNGQIQAICDAAHKEFTRKHCKTINSNAHWCWPWPLF